MTEAARLFMQVLGDDAEKLAGDVGNEMDIVMKAQTDVDRVRWRRWLTIGVMALFFGLATLLGVWQSNIAFAQADVPAASTGAQEITLDQVNAVAREIWCPLCSGVRLDACELKACAQMKDVIAIKLAEGEDTDSIKAYFVEQYGPQVMGEPPREGFNWLAWILPAVAVVAGGFFFWRTTQRMMQPATPLDAQPTLAKSLDGSGSVTGSMTDNVTAEQNPAVDNQAVAERALDALDDEDEYTQKLEEELAKYG